MDDDKLTHLLERFRARCRADGASLHAAKDEPARFAEEPLRTTIHRLAGLAGSFGYTDLSAKARILDDRLEAANLITTEEIEDLLAELAKAAEPSDARNVTLD